MFSSSLCGGQRGAQIRASAAHSAFTGDDDALLTEELLDGRGSWSTCIHYYVVANIVSDV
eukprot:365478-Chlamydomonas_euryale.AAC.10